MLKKIFVVGFWIAVPNSLLADTYQVYFPSTMPGMITNGSGGFRTDLNMVIVNTDSMKVTQVDLDQYLQTYSAARYSFGSNFATTVDGTSLNADKRLIQDFKGSTLIVRENGAIQARDKGADGIALTPDDGPNLYFDRILEINVNTGAIESETLIATSQAGFNAAVTSGFNVQLAETGDVSGATLINFKTFSENVSNNGSSTNALVTNGSFSTKQITSTDGSSLFRQEADGTVHIGENSIVLADETVSQSGNDEIYSSSDVLQLGNDSNHRTVVRGTLEVSTPTQSNHAANKGYVDTKDAATLVAARSYADTQDAATLVSARSYADTQDAATLQSAKIYANGVAAMSMAASQISMNANPQAPIGFGIGFGNIGGQSAFAMGLTGYTQNSGVRYSLTASHNATTKQTGIGAGVFFSLR